MKEKIIKNIKFVLFLGIIILCYFISDKFINYIMTIDMNTLKRVVNIILVTLSCTCYFKTDNKTKVIKEKKARE